ncbi:MAG: methionine-R-sulfoxide reductase [bacterium]
MAYKKLTPEEKKIIENKGTEKPFTGEYNGLFDSGTYSCKRCGAKLFMSEDKFDAGCGWPSFDDEIKGAIKRETDTDGRRTEIMCANCEAHLGHVFAGEGHTAKNIRHCVNSLALNFIKDDK